MHYIRVYAKKRLKDGERLWWLEEKAEPEHSLPIQVRLYTQLQDEEKRRLRAEAAILCPQVVKSSTARNKYNDVAFYLLTYQGVLVSNVRDLFTAGSVAGNAGGESPKEKSSYDHIKRALKDIEIEMIEASARLEDALFVEYWGESVAPEARITKWLERADELAAGWTPSKELFLLRRK